MTMTVQVAAPASVVPQVPPVPGNVPQLPLPGFPATSSRRIVPEAVAIPDPLSVPLLMVMGTDRVVIEPFR